MFPTDLAGAEKHIESAQGLVECHLEEQAIVTMRITADVPSNRQLILTLPPEVPTGPAEVTVTVDSDLTERERSRAEALVQFLALAKSSSFHSSEPYSTRAELYERH